MLAVDTTVASGSHHNRLYLGYDLNPALGQPLYVAYSDNVSSWTKIVVWGGIGARNIGAYPAIGPNGEVYVAWNDYGDSSGGHDVLMNRPHYGNTNPAPRSQPPPLS